MTVETLRQTKLARGEGRVVDLDLSHWRVVVGEDDIAWLLLDQTQDGTKTSTNTLSEEVLEELSRAVDAAKSEKPRALVIRSLKSSSFIVGADVSEFEDENDEDTVLDRLHRAHAVLNRIEAMDCPTVAMIHGHCLGGGLELALACDYRIAREDAELGFPEVQLGLHPGLGGTVRLPRLIDPAESLKMMLTGKPAPAKKAKALGLVDDVLPERHVHAAVRAIASGDLEPHSASIKDRVLESGPGRKFVASQGRKETEKRTRAEHYPAPFALLDLFESPGDGFEDMIESEARSFANLLVGEPAQNLIRVFRLRNRLKRGSRDASDLHKVHVIGAGTMGGDIAAWLASHGKLVSLEDQGADLIAPAVKRANALFKDRSDSQPERVAARDRFIPDLRGDGRKRADLVVEAIPEKVDLKREVLGDVESSLKGGAIIATNTSSILLEDVRGVLDNGAMFAGLHFFNPVPQMPLVEVVADDRVDRKVAERLEALCLEIDKLPIKVKSAPGFLVNRVLTPYLLEALKLMDQDEQPEKIDAAAQDFGMPVGPVELSDQIGLDICLDVADMLIEHLDQPLPSVPDWFRKKVEDGDVGVKSGQGLYRWKDGEAKKGDVVGDIDDELVDRLVLPIVNTAVMCVAEGIVTDTDLADGALIFGTGFAPFRGGPIHYARQRGGDDVKERLNTLAELHGERFRPAPGWTDVVHQ